jgi:hypothetical protein
VKSLLRLIAVGEIVSGIATLLWCLHFLSLSSGPGKTMQALVMTLMLVVGTALVVAGVQLFRLRGAGRVGSLAIMALLVLVTGLLTALSGRVQADQVVRLAIEAALVGVLASPSACRATATRPIGWACHGAWLKRESRSEFTSWFERASRC